MTANVPRPRLDAHIGYLFSERPLEERVAAAALAGFGGVEHSNPYDVPAARMAGLLRDAELSFVQLALPTGDPSLGGKGIAIFPEQRDGFRRSIETALTYAEHVGCGIVHPMAGIRPAGCEWGRLWDTYLENLACAANLAAAVDIVVVVEPIGSGSICNYFLADPFDALLAIETVAAPNLRLMVDVFHLANGAHDPIEFVRRHADKIGHVQIADHPGRHEPGTGLIDFPGLIQALSESGYAGFIGCEYIPCGATEAGLGWLGDWTW